MAVVNSIVMTIIQTLKICKEHTMSVLNAESEAVAKWLRMVAEELRRRCLSKQMSFKAAFECFECREKSYFD